MSLTDKQKLFCELYTRVGSLTYLNATQSAIGAGYSANTAQQTGSENLSKPLIQEEIQKHVKATAERCAVSRERTLKAIARIAYNEDGDCTTKEQLDGLEKLAKYDNLYEKNNESTAPKIEIKYVDTKE